MKDWWGGCWEESKDIYITFESATKCSVLESQCPPKKAVQQLAQGWELPIGLDISASKVLPVLDEEARETSCQYRMRIGNVPRKRVADVIAHLGGEEEHADLQDINMGVKNILGPLYRGREFQNPPTVVDIVASSRFSAHRTSLIPPNKDDINLEAVDNHRPGMEV